MVKKRSVICECGGDIYESDYVRPVDAPEGTEWRNVWRCANCFRETPRKRVNRRSNHMRAIQSYLDLSKAWEPVNEALNALVAEGKAMGGAILVHSSTFNWHLKQLTDKDKPSNFDVRYHTEQAKLDMAKAEAFIAEKRAL